MKRSFFIFAVLSFVFLFISCQSKVKVYKASLFPELKKREMEVLLVSPQGKVETERESDAIVVTFNQPIVPFTKAECMYEPEIFGTTEQTYIEIK